MSRIGKAGNLYETCKDYFARLIPVAPAAGDTVEPGLVLTFAISLADGAAGDSDFVVDDAFEVIGFDVIKRNGAGAGNTATLKKGANAITGAVAAAVDNTKTSATTIDDAQSTFAKGDTLRITRNAAAGTNDMLCLVHVVMR